MKDSLRKGPYMILKDYILYRLMLQIIELQYKLRAITNIVPVVALNL